MKPKTSVALCTYNGEKYLPKQLESIISQSIKIDQIILSDDNSNDNTFEILKQFQDTFKKDYDIVVLNNNPGLGVVKNFENAIKYCSGEIIFTSDQDDVWNTQKVEKILDVFHKNTNCGMVFTNAVLIDSSGAILPKKLWDMYDFKGDTSKWTISRRLFHSNFVTGATMAFRREVFEKAFPFPEIPDFYHDYWLTLVANLTYDIVGINEPLLKYRQHDNNVVGCIKEKRGISEKILDRKDLLSKITQSKLKLQKAMVKLTQEKQLEKNEIMKIYMKESELYFKESKYLDYPAMGYFLFNISLDKAFYRNETIKLLVGNILVLFGSLFKSEREK